MSRSGVPSGFSDASLTAFVAVELAFDSGTTRLWNGYGDLTVASNTYTGSGDLMSISAIEENSEISAKGLNLVLSGIPSSLLSLALTENYQNRNCKVYVGTISSGTVAAYEAFSGRMDVRTLKESGDTCTIALTAESRLIDLERPRVRRYTAEDQKLIDSDDTGLDFINSLQEATFEWRA